VNQGVETGLPESYRECRKTGKIRKKPARKFLKVRKRIPVSLFGKGTGCSPGAPLARGSKRGVPRQKRFPCEM